MVEILRELGSGVCGTVYVARSGDLKYALKAFHNRNAFYTENRAYWKCKRIESLVGRLPSYKGVLAELPPALAQRRHLYRQAIGVDLITGPTLRATIDFLPLSRLQALQDFLVHTLRIIHDEAGVCHGDVRADNIMLLSEDSEAENAIDVRAILLDFSHAYFKKDMSPKRWEIWKERDHEMLRDIFSEAKARLGTEAALNFVNSTTVLDACQQVKLADLISAVYPSQSLLAAIQSVDSPIPALAISIARAISRSGQVRDARAFLETYTPPELPKSSDEDNRQLLRVESELAHLYARTSHPISAKLYEQVIAKCTEMLGATDYYTMNMRFAYARYLRGLRTADAVTVCLEMLRDLFDLYERRADDLSPCKGEPVSAPHAELWKRKLVHEVQRMMGRVYDETVHNQARTVLRQIATPCVRQQDTQPTLAKGPKRKFDASIEDQGNRSAMDNGKTFKAEIGPPAGDEASSDKENIHRL